jgi:hypothetical protein
MHAKCCSKNLKGRPIGNVIVDVGMILRCSRQRRDETYMIKVAERT